MLILPLHDDNPTRRMPVVTIAIIALNVVMFVYQLALPEREGLRFVFGFGMIPAVLFGEAELPLEIPTVAPWLTLVTSMFLHGGVMHVAGNMLYLWTFGNNIEDAMGPSRFLGFYFLCGLAAAMAQALVDPASEVPMIGASGAVSGVLGAYLLLHPSAKVLTFVVFRTFWIAAAFVLGWWIVVQVANAMIMQDELGGVAWFAHIGGFVAGMALIALFKRRDVPMFGGRTRSGPWG